MELKNKRNTCSAQVLFLDVFRLTLTAVPRSSFKTNPKIHSNTTVTGIQVTGIQQSPEYRDFKRPGKVWLQVAYLGVDVPYYFGARRTKLGSKLFLEMLMPGREGGGQEGREGAEGSEHSGGSGVATPPRPSPLLYQRHPYQTRPPAPLPPPRTSLPTAYVSQSSPTPRPHTVTAHSNPNPGRQTRPLVRGLRHPQPRGTSRPTPAASLAGVGSGSPGGP